MIFTNNMDFINHIIVPLSIVLILLVAILVFTIIVTRKEINKK